MAKRPSRNFASSFFGGIGAVFRAIRTDLRRSVAVNTTLFFVRAFYFCTLRSRLRTIEADDAFPVTVKHNLRMLWKKLNRMLLLISPLSVLEQADKNAKILVIGPRNEWDLFLLKQAGFQFDNCVGLDLISYSPRILLGDMHAMPFEEGQFDIVLCGWTLSYSANPALAAREIARVCKKSGIVGVSVEYATADEAGEKEATGGYLIRDARLDKRVNSTAEILSLFPGHGAVYFDHDAPLKRSVPRDPMPSNCAVLFENA